MEALVFCSQTCVRSLTWHEGSASWLRKGLEGLYQWLELKLIQSWDKNIEEALGWRVRTRTEVSCMGLREEPWK